VEIVGKSNKGKDLEEMRRYKRKKKKKKISVEVEV